MVSRKDNLLRFKIALMKIQLKIRVRSGYIDLTVVETEHEKSTDRKNNSNCAKDHLLHL